MSKVVVIGSGIAGLTSAYYLAKAGYSVSVYEQEGYPAMRCSYANGGQISVSNSEVWNTWANVWKGIKWLLKKDAPLLIRPSLDWDKALWLSKFLLTTANNTHALYTAQTIRLGLKARQLYENIIRDEDIKFDQKYCGILHFYKDEKYWKSAQAVQELYESNGCEWELLTPKQVKDKDPALDKIEGIIGGAWTPRDWTGDIHKFCKELSIVLKQKYQVEFLYNKTVESLEDVVGYDYIVVAGGVGSVKLAQSIKDKLPIYPVKGYSITITADDIKSFEALPRVSLLDDQAKIVTSTLVNRLRVAGTAELNGENYDILKDRIDPLLNWVRNNLPDVPTENYSSWACLRPMTPNMMPIVKQSKVNPKVFYHTGHGHLGWTLSPATAQQLVGIMKNE